MDDSKQAHAPLKTIHKSPKQIGTLILIDEFSTNGTIVNRQKRRSRVKNIELRIEDQMKSEGFVGRQLMNTEELEQIERVVAQLRRQIMIR